jgi:hypothetical protein
MAEKIYVNVALSNAETCVCCDENGNTVDCCIVGAEFGGMYHPDGVEAACIWAAEHIDLMRTLSNQVTDCCAGKCQAIATSSLPEEPNDTDVNSGEERTIIVDLPLDGSMVTIDENGARTAEGDDLVVVEIPEGVVAKSGVLSDPEAKITVDGEVIDAITDEDLSYSSDPEVEFPNGDGLLLAAGLPESCCDELLGAGLDTPEKVLAHEDLSQIKGIGVKTRDKILGILSEGE